MMDRGCQKYFDAFSQTSDGEIRNEYYDPFTIKHRKKTTKMQLEILEKTFETNNRPDTYLRRLLAEQLGMTPRSIQVWFQNRRAKEKKMAQKAYNFGPHQYTSVPDDFNHVMYSSANFCFSATNNSLFKPPVPLNNNSVFPHNFIPLKNKILSDVGTIEPRNFDDYYRDSDSNDGCFVSSINAYSDKGKYHCE